MKYNWQLPNWPHFEYTITNLHSLFSQFAEETGEVKGIMQTIGVEQQQETALLIMLSEAINSSEIEGEHVSRQDIMSSLYINLELAIASETALV